MDETMKATEYSVAQMQALLREMSDVYDLARVVDPIECRVLEFNSDGTVSINKSCYGIWNAGQKCVNCSSAIACQTRCRQEKDESFQDKVFHIQSNPVTLKLPDGGAYDAVVELVTVDANGNARGANDRAAENVDHNAARFQAVHDSLTTALNTGAFFELARDIIVKRPGVDWVMITGNIMNFRLVNTLFGVLKGNEMLVRTAAALRQIADEASGICGRVGSDQFAMLLPQEGYSDDILLNAAQALSEAFSSGIYTYRIHFGVYRIDDASLPISVMCGRANTALYTIRESLRQTIACFDEEMLQKSLFEQEIISGFEEALKTGQFQMYLQPLVGRDGSAFGAEALVRWCRPDGSVIMPGDFIEILEQAGLIHELDRYIWECAVMLLSMWKHTDKRDMTISVNMSAKDFYSIDVYRELTELVERYKVDSRLLRLEITETALLEDPEKSDEIISRLREKGFLVEIDDFGKGYSSLSMLKDIQADVLKIDISLLREIESKERSRIILESVINMANSLGMDVITEGVETEEQLQALTGMGCHHFQGYYFSRPIPAAEFGRSTWSND